MASSSSVSRRAHCSGVSPASIRPPGKHTSPGWRCRAAERTSKKVFLRADGSVPYERVAQVMGALNAGGFNNIGLVTDAGGPSMDGN